MSCPWPVTVAPFRARFGTRRIAEKKRDMAHEETQKNFGAGRIAKKTARYGARRKKKKTRIAHEEINKTRDGRCMRKFQKPGFSGAKNYGINGAFPYEIAEKTRFSKKTRIEAPFGA